MVKNNGFTLIEILIVVVIIGILAAISYPAYTQYIIKTNRIDAQSEMIRIASLMQRYKVLNFTYLKGGQPLVLDDLNILEDYPSPTKKLYKLELSNVTAGTWTLNAIPKGMQVGNGTITLNHNGQKCWTKGSTCTPSTTTNWDGR